MSLVFCSACPFASFLGQGVSRLACAGSRSQRQTTHQEGGNSDVNSSTTNGYHGGWPINNGGMADKHTAYHHGMNIAHQPCDFWCTKVGLSTNMAPQNHFRHHLLTLNWSISHSWTNPHFNHFQSTSVLSLEKKHSMCVDLVHEVTSSSASLLELRLDWL